MKKIVIIISIVLFIVLIGSELYIQSDAFSRKIRPVVLEPLRELLGPEARIGVIKAHVILPSLEVRDISIPDESGRDAVVIRKIKAYINPLPLFLKKVRLPFISIIEPRIYAVRSQDGTINLTPLIDRLRANAVRSGSGEASGFSLLLRNLSLKRGRIEYRDELTSVQFSTQDLNVKARVYLSQDRFTTSIRSSRIRVSTPAYPEISGKFSARAEYDKGRVRLNKAELSTADAAIAVSGIAGLLPESALDLKVSGRSGPQVIGRFFDFLRPAVKKGRTSRFELLTLIRGTRTDPVIEGTVKATHFPFKNYLLRDGALSFAYQDGYFEVTGRKWKLTKRDEHLFIDAIDAALVYSRGGIDIMRLDLLARDLSLHGDGRADPETGFDVHLNAVSSGKGKAISFLTGQSVEGAVNVSGLLSGPLLSPQFNGDLLAGPVTVRGVLFSLVKGRIEYDDKELKLSSVEIREGTSRYVFDGSVDMGAGETVYSARLKVLKSDVVNIVDLFYKQLPLKLSVSGELTFQGKAREYTGSGFLALDAGVAYGESFTRGAITTKLSTGKVSFPQVVLYKEQGMVKGTGWISYSDRTYSADLESLGVDLSAVDYLSRTTFGGPFELDVHSSGSFTSPFVKASLDTDELSCRETSVGGLSMALEIKDFLFSLSTALTEEKGDLSIQWALKRPYTWTVEAKVNSDAIDPFLVAGEKEHSGAAIFVADGKMTAHGKGRDTSSIAGEAVFRKLGVVTGDYRIDNDSEVKLSVKNGEIEATSLNLIGPGTRVGVTGDAELFSKLDIALTGSVDLSLLKILYREVEHASGLAEVKLAVRGDWNTPDVEGELQLLNGEVKIKDIPQRFTALNSTIIFSEGRIVTESMSGEMGGGTLSASGWAQLTGTAVQDFSARASMKDVTVRYPEGLTSTLTGELFYDGDSSEQSLSGDVTIKRARYNKRIEWKTMLVEIGRGLYQKRKTDVGWIGDTLINVRFHGSDDILFQNNLAKMPLNVDVFLQGTVNYPKLLGRIEAREGSFYFRKNEFKILSSSADFVDPTRMNPVLDIQAETRVREYRIWLAVTGTAEHAQITLISEPSLIDTDILSLLALGKKGSELYGKEKGVGVGEAASFATGQFQDIFERRASSLIGLDRFQVDPYVSKSDTSVPRITVGKELMQDKLYVTYSSNVGADAPEQLFRLEYLLDRHFSIVGEQNELGNTGADIKYRFEFR
jgi:autotransporter translocation and assembly factor TamB